MGSLRWMLLASLVVSLLPRIAMSAPPPKSAPAKVSPSSLPVIKPLATKKDSAVFRAPDAEAKIEIFAVDVSGDALLFATTPRINWAFKATDKRFTGAVSAPNRKSDAFATIADAIGADVSPITPTKKHRGATLDLEFRAAPLHDLLRLIGDTGRVNVVVAPGELPTLTVRTKRLPWDLAIEAFTARAGLTTFRDGNTYYVVPAGTKVEVGTKYSGPLVDLEVRDGTLAQAVTALRALTPLEHGSCSRTKLSMRVKRMPVQQVIKALEIASGEKLTDKAACPSTALGAQPASELTLTAIATLGTKRAAAFSHKGALVVGQRDAQPRIKDLGSTWVELATGEELQMYPSSPMPDHLLPAPPVPVITRTAALVKRGFVARAIVETSDGLLVVSAEQPLSENTRVEVTQDGINVLVDGAAPRLVPLASR